MLAAGPASAAPASALIGLAIGISLIGWFGIQSAVSAQGLAALVGGLPQWAWSLLFGLLVTAIVLRGFHSMTWTAYVTVPAFLILVGWSIISELTRHDLGALVARRRTGTAPEPAGRAPRCRGRWLHRRRRHHPGHDPVQPDRSATS